MILAIDTSTDSASLALVQGEEAPTELTWRCEQNHTVELLPHLARLLDEVKVDIKSIRWCYCGQGTGEL